MNPNQDSATEQDRLMTARTEQDTSVIACPDKNSREKMTGERVLLTTMRSTTMTMTTIGAVSCSNGAVKEQQQHKRDDTPSANDEQQETKKHIIMTGKDTASDVQGLQFHHKNAGTIPSKHNDDDDDIGHLEAANNKERAPAAAGILKGERTASAGVLFTPSVVWNSARATHNTNNDDDDDGEDVSRCAAKPTNVPPYSANLQNATAGNENGDYGDDSGDNNDGLVGPSFTRTTTRAVPSKDKKGEGEDLIESITQKRVAEALGFTSRNEVKEVLFTGHRVGTDEHYIVPHVVSSKKEGDDLVEAVTQERVAEALLSTDAGNEMEDILFTSHRVRPVGMDETSMLEAQCALVVPEIEDEEEEREEGFNRHHDTDAPATAPRSEGSVVQELDGGNYSQCAPLRTTALKSLEVLTGDSCQSMQLSSDRGSGAMTDKSSCIELSLSSNEQEACEANCESIETDGAPFSRNRWKLGISIAFLIVVGLATGIGLLLTRQTMSGLHASTDGPALPDEDAENFLHEIRFRLMGQDAIWLDPDSPQMMATEWLAFVDSPRLQVDSPRLTQRYVLMVIYFGNTGGEKIWEIMGWALSGNHECDWKLVECDENGVVKHLMVEQMAYSLTGSIPTEIALLEPLESFHLIAGRVGGELPTELYSLTNLVSLRLTSNQFTSTISSEIGKLSKLEVLRLNDNYFEGSLPDELAMLTDMKEFFIHRNYFECNVFPIILHWKKLQNLVISHMQGIVGTIPTELATLTDLERFIAGNTRLDGTVPSEIGEMTNLIIFSVPNNRHNGTFPIASLGRLSNLEEFIVSLNPYESQELPTTIGKLTSIRFFDGIYSNFRGTIPTEVGLLTSSIQLEFGFNGFTGTIPAELGQISSLMTIRLEENFFSGTMPEGLCEENHPNPGLWVYFDCSIKCDCCRESCGSHFDV